VESLAYQTLVALIRNGTLGLSDIEVMARRFTQDGDDDGAHDCRAAWLDASAPEPAEFARSKLRSIDGGGKPEG
jgi:hypothetical protein